MRACMHAPGRYVHLCVVQGSGEGVEVVGAGGQVLLRHAVLGVDAAGAERQDGAARLLHGDVAGEHDDVGKARLALELLVYRLQQREGLLGAGAGRPVNLYNSTLLL